MLVSFEGQDGAGKTSLLDATLELLQQQDVPAVKIEEFSDSPHGQRLLEALSQDKFLRPMPGEAATPITRALDIVADLYYQDDRTIGPARGHGHVVLKDRHLDTVVYALAPALVSADSVSSEAQAVAWLANLCSQLRHVPDLTVYVDAPLSVRIERIQSRQRHLSEDRANRVSPDDIEVFEARDRIAHQLIAKEPDRFLVLDNTNQPIAEGAEQIVDHILARRDQTGSP
ncbi:dTMP kinase [Glycomyces xiaoerkulensis]|uniref:dTMP kinase n=1 Tax=Glycomyces xiaoerkulensis TaxID=2038139 RepID=UPI001E4C456F|nr:hypothetical protein [Glycomyces xiaoerkulensis]